jgi:hypothetical protein
MILTLSDIFGWALLVILVIILLAVSVWGLK